MKWDVAEFVRSCVPSIERAPNEPAFIVGYVEAEDEAQGALIYLPRGMGVDEWYEQRRVRQAELKARREAKQ